jgi:hypothetical protein
MGERRCEDAFSLPWMFTRNVPRGTVYQGMGCLWGNVADFPEAPTAARSEGTGDW